LTSEDQKIYLFLASNAKTAQSLSGPLSGRPTASKETDMTFIGLAGLAAAACLVLKPAARAGADVSGRPLTVFFSWSGHSSVIARRIAEKTGSPIVELETVKPYPTAYGQCVEQARKEQNENIRPKLKTKIDDLGRYDSIVLVYPNWWGSIPGPMASFLAEHDLSGKIIFPVCTHGGGGQGRSREDIAARAPQAAVKAALAIREDGGAGLSTALDDWLTEISDPS
jgi:flavodoxin